MLALGEFEIVMELEAEEEQRCPTLE